MLHAVHGDVDEGGGEDPAALLEPLRRGDHFDQAVFGLALGVVLVEVAVQDGQEFGV